MGAGPERSGQEAFVIETIHDCHYGRVRQPPCRKNGLLDLANCNRRVAPNGFHDVQFQRSEHQWDSRSSIISCAPSLLGACDGIERTRKVSCRRDIRREIVSPTWTSRPALASCPFTITRPASHVSLASVRRRITRLHFKKRSRRIGSTWGHGGPRPLIFRCSFVGVFRGAGVDVSFSDPDESVGPQFGEVFPDFSGNSLLPELVEDVLLS